MPTRARALAAPAAVALLGVLVLAVMGLQTMAFTDYEVPSRRCWRCATAIRPASCATSRSTAAR